MQGSYSSSFRSTRMPHFFSSVPGLSLVPPIRPFSLATPNTLHDGYSLQARLKLGMSVGGPGSPLLSLQPTRAAASPPAATTISPHRNKRFTIGSFGYLWDATLSADDFTLTRVFVGQVSNLPACRQVGNLPHGKNPHPRLHSGKAGRGGATRQSRCTVAAVAGRSDSGVGVM